MMIDLIHAELATSASVLEEFSKNASELKKIEDVANMMADSLRNEGKIVSCGNGGSMSDAMHFAEELSAKYREPRKALAAIAISDPAYITCAVNDFGNEQVFSRFVEAMLTEKDILFTLSTSGNSVNVIEAAKSAHLKRAKVISLTGNDGGGLKDFSDININVPFIGFADRIQEMHIKIIHILILLVEKILLDKNYA